ncbi:MAG: hypothetical protein KKG99_02180 [Bacteroidetes bacterium]|nr:hypothetical protein [Bacteroidota bacterium]
MRRIIAFFTIIILLNVACSKIIVQPPQSNQNLEDFEMTWNTINDVYPMLDNKNIDWDSIYTIYRSRTEKAVGDEFSQVLIDLLCELKDMHVYYVNKGRGLVFPYISPRHQRDWKAFSPLVVRRYFNTPLKLACSEKVEFGISVDNIGYIYIATFNEEGLLAGFDDVLNQLMDTKGLIIDVRHNSGGLMENIRWVVGRFITESMPVLKIQNKGGTDILYDPFEPTVGKVPYTKPVVVLINGVARSGGDIIADVLRQINNVTLVGDTTAGAGCYDIEEQNQIRGNRILPSGRYINIPNTCGFRYDGIPIEWNGVPPDVYIKQTENDINAGRDLQLEYAINRLK